MSNFMCLQEKKVETTQLDQQDEDETGAISSMVRGP